MPNMVLEIPAPVHLQLVSTSALSKRTAVTDGSQQQQIRSGLWDLGVEPTDEESPNRNPRARVRARVTELVEPVLVL